MGKRCSLHRRHAPRVVNRISPEFGRLSPHPMRNCIVFCPVVSIYWAKIPRRDISLICSRISSRKMWLLRPPPCRSSGNIWPGGQKMLQTASVVVMLYEADGSFRQIHTDGRKLAADNPLPSWMGYSTGKWEEDTLVVDTGGFNDRSWLDAAGHPHSDALHVTERFHRRDIGHMEVQITVDDPKSYSKPFTTKINQLLMPDTDLIESVCLENETDVKHLR
jgi:hypothetical protein